MNAMGHSPQSTWPGMVPLAKARAECRIDRDALAAAAADRRARLRNIETIIETACEAAVRKRSPKHRDEDRDTWDRSAWSVYVDEAVRLTRFHARTIAALRREAEHLEHLVACFSSGAR